MYLVIRGKKKNGDKNEIHPQVLQDPTKKKNEKSAPKKPRNDDDVIMEMLSCTCYLLSLLLSKKFNPKSKKNLPPFLKAHATEESKFKQLLTALSSSLCFETHSGTSMSPYYPAIVMHVFRTLGILSSIPSIGQKVLQISVPSISAFCNSACVRYHAPPHKKRYEKIFDQNQWKKIKKYLTAKTTLEQIAGLISIDVDLTNNLPGRSPALLCLPELYGLIMNYKNTPLYLQLSVLDFQGENDKGGAGEEDIKEFANVVDRYCKRIIDLMTKAGFSPATLSGGKMCDNVRCCIIASGSKSLLRCTRCHKVYYCDRMCQKVAWGEGGHKHTCGK